MNKELKKDIIRIFLIVIASVIIAANLKIFVNAGGLFPGGFTGITILLQRCALKYWGMKLPFSPINLLLNAVPAAICFKHVGKKFTMLSCLCIVLVSVFTDILPEVPLTYDVLLISIFGGIVMGAGIGVCLMAEATSGGTDFIAMYISNRFGVDAFSYILVGNVVLFMVAGLLFGWDAALYSIIFQFCSTQVVHIFNKRYQRNTLLVITEYPDEVSDVIFKVAHHGATKIEAQGAYTKKDRPIVYSIVSSDEVKRTIVEIKKVDEDAFINVIKTDQMSGNFYMPPMD